MGQIWRAAKRDLGYNVGRRDSLLLWVVVVLGCVIRVFFRFLFGRPMRGDRGRKTDAEFFKRGTRALSANARTPGRWSYLPEWQRAVIRLGVLLVVVALLWGLVTGGLFDAASPLHNVISAAAVTLVVAVTWVLIVRIDAAVRDVKHNRAVTKPFKQAIAPLLGVATREVRVHLPRRALGQRTQKKEENTV
jgi:hypothetical protein